MIVKLLVLFLTPLISGALIYVMPKGRETNFRLLLGFAGSYLFAITIIHILPDLYQSQVERSLLVWRCSPVSSFSSFWNTSRRVWNMVTCMLTDINTIIIMNIATSRTCIITRPIA